MPRPVRSCFAALVVCAAFGGSGCYRSHERSPVGAAATDATGLGQPAGPTPDRSADRSPQQQVSTAADGQQAAAPGGPDTAGTATDATGPTRPLLTPPPGLRVAFFGDQGIGPDAKAVLELVAAEHADAVVHLGDFAYDLGKPQLWEDQIDAVLGRDFPYFAAIGNHDVFGWPGPGGFAQLLKQRLSRVADAHCQGQLGVNALCTFRGLQFVLSGVGTYGSGHENFLRAALRSSSAAFRLCLWHKNQHDMQVGAKPDEVGWQAYRICARYGAAIITGHEHSYARTRTLTAIGDAAHGHGATGIASRLELGPGRTAVFVSGLGGQSARPRTDDHVTDTWWASIYAQNYQLENASVVARAPTIHFGALFIDFNVNGDPYSARGYFKTTDGQVHDRFELHVAAPAPPPH